MIHSRTGQGASRTKAPSRSGPATTSSAGSAPARRRIVPTCFANNYNKVSDIYYTFARVYHETYDNGNPWEKDWRQALPQEIVDGGYNVEDIGLWLWERFISDGGASYGALERAHILSLLGSSRDLAFLLCTRQRRIENGVTPNNLADLESDYTYCEPSIPNPSGEGTIISPEDKALVQHGYTEDDVTTTPHIVALVNEMAARSLLLDSLEEEERHTANWRIGQAINFIVGTPYIFAQEASHP